MKNFYATLLTIALIAAASSASAQWTIGATGGLLNYYGDASQNVRFNPNSSRPGGALSIENRFGFLRPQFQVLGGRLYGRKDYLNLEMHSTHIEASLKLGVDVMQLINSGSPIEVSVNGAAVGAYYTPTVTYINSNELVPSSHVNVTNNIGFGLGFGGRLGYQLNSTWKLLGGIDMRYYLTNDVDAYLGTQSTTNDWLSYIYAGVGYTLGGGGRIADEEGDPDPRRLFVGEYTYNNLPKSGVTMELYDEKDNLLSTTETGMDGTFSFSGLKPGKDYTVKVSDEDAGPDGGGKMYVVNAAGTKVEKLSKRGANKYAYTQIPQDEVNQMAEIEVDDSETIMKGMFAYKKLAKGGVKLNLYDNSGVKVGSTVTDIAGKFEFRGLTPDETYVVKLSEDDKVLFNQGKLYLINSEGKRVVASERPDFNEYKFVHLTTENRDGLPVLEEVESEAKMRGVFTYNDLPKAGVKLYIVDEDDNKIDSVMTGVDGSFQFSELAPNKSYMVRVADGNVEDTKGIEMFFLNADDEVVMRAGREKDDKFSFEAMEEGDLATLQVLKADVAGEGKMLYRRETFDGEYIKGEPDSNVIDGFELVGDTPDAKDKPRDPNEALYNVSFEKETIFFEHNKYSIDQDQNNSKGSVIAKKMKANPAMRIEIQGYASQPGTKAYNLLLSQRRADELKRVLVEKYGIDPGRIVPVGKGEDPAVNETEARRAGIIILEKESFKN